MKWIDLEVETPPHKMAVALGRYEEYETQRHDVTWISDGVSVWIGRVNYGSETVEEVKSSYNLSEGTGNEFTINFKGINGNNKILFSEDTIKVNDWTIHSDGSITNDRITL